MALFAVAEGETVVRLNVAICKKLQLSFLWACVFFIVTLAFGMVGYSVIGASGVPAEHADLVLVGRIWSVTLFGSPILGLALGLLGLLPGCRKR